MVVPLTYADDLSPTQIRASCLELRVLLRPTVMVLLNPQPAQKSFLPPLHFVLLAVAAALVATFYLWSLTPDPADRDAPHGAHRYFAWQADGWLAGRLDLPRTVPAGLL